MAGRVRWEPFWEPDESWRQVLADAGVRFHYVDMSRAKALYVLQDVRRLTRDRGLAISWPVDRAPRWEVAHFGFLRARRHGRGRDFVDAVYRARWEQGRDISDPETIGAVAAELGLDAAEHAGAAEDPELRDEALAALRRWTGTASSGCRSSSWAGSTSGGWTGWPRSPRWSGPSRRPPPRTPTEPRRTGRSRCWCRAATPGTPAAAADSQKPSSASRSATALTLASTVDSASSRRMSTPPAANIGATVSSASRNSVSGGSA